jgi:hypothetical protein
MILGTLIDLIGSIGTLIFSFMKDITDEEINKNIEFLKRYDWFKELLENNEYKKLINDNDNVRYVIGKINIEKMKKITYQNKYRKKIKFKLQKNS